MGVATGRGLTIPFVTSDPA